MSSQTSAEIALVAAVAFITFTAGCSGPARPASSSAGPLTLTIGIGEADSASQSSGMPTVIKNQTLEPLMRLDRDGRLSPALAEGVHYTSDGSLQITLRPNVAFHDGSW